MASSGSFNTSAYDGRYLTFAWEVSSQSVANNTSTISWTLKGAGTGGSSWYNAGNFKVVINGSTVYSSSTRIKLYNGTLVASGNYTITHTSDGSKSFSASAQAGIYYVAVNCTGSGTFTLPQIPRQATITKATNFNDTGNPTITYSNPAGNNVTSLQACISLTGSSADIPYRNISKTGTSYTFNLTEAERNTLRQATPNSNTLSVRFYVQTVISGTTYRNYVTATMTIVNGNPTFETGYLDTNSNTVAITHNNLQIIQNKSTLRINIANATAYKYATISKATVNINGNIITETFSGSSIIFNIGTINVANNITVPVTVYDSRNNSTTINLNIIVLEWKLPSAIITLERESNYYSNTNLTVNANYSSLNNNNTITIQYQIKKVSDSSYGSLTTIQDNVQTTFTADNQYSWNVKVILTDKISSYTYDLLLYKGIPLVYFDKYLSSVGFNCFPKNEYSFEVNGLKMFYASGDVMEGTSSGTGSAYILTTGGFVTSSGKNVSFTIPINKPTNCTSADVTVSIVVRQNGNYIVGSASASVSYTINNCPVSPAGVYVNITHSTALTNVTNNDSVGIAFTDYEVTFN